MTPTTQAETPAVQPQTPTLDDFFDRVRRDNPFDVNRVVQSAAGAIDAAQVHGAEYGQLLDLADKARRQHLGIGVLVWGEAGIGKSHLLARLGRERTSAAFVYLANLQASPAQLPRSLLRCVVSILTRGRVRHLHQTPLFQLINAAVRQALTRHHHGAQRPSWEDAASAFERLVDELGEATPAQAAVVDRAGYRVLFAFFRSAYSACSGADDGAAELAVRWLSGDALDPEEAQALWLTKARPGAEAIVVDDAQIMRVLIALANLAAYRAQPFVLCLDQVDCLEAEQMAALARFLQALLDSASNLLVVTAGLRSTLQAWFADGVIQESAWHRLAQYEIMLQRVSPRAAGEIVQARLQPFQEPFLGMEAVRDRVQQDVLFPLGAAWSAEFLAGKIDVRPRDVLNWARLGFSREQEALRRLGGPAWLAGWGRRAPEPEAPSFSADSLPERIDQKVALKLQEQIGQRQPEALPPDAENLVGLLETLLRRCEGDPSCASLLSVERPVQPKQGSRLPYDLVLRQRTANDQEMRTGVLCVTASNRTSMAAAVRRLVQDEQPAERIVLIADERRPLDLAQAGQSYLDQLRHRGGVWFQQATLPFVQYAELDALAALLGVARSGDLEIDLPDGQGRPVTEAEVLASYQRQQRLTAHPLLRRLLSVEPPPSKTSPKPAEPERAAPATEEQELRRYLVSQLALLRGANSAALAVKYQHYLEMLKRPQLDRALCQEQVEAAARRLHADGFIELLARDDGLYLRLR